MGSPRDLCGICAVYIFINGLEKGVSSVVAKFADDTKLFKVVKTKAGGEELQKDLA